MYVSTAALPNPYKFGRHNWWKFSIYFAVAIAKKKREYFFSHDFHIELSQLEL